MKIIALIATIAAGAFIYSGAVMAQDTKEKNISVETVEGAETLVTDKAFELFQKSASFLDVRTEAMYNKARIPGAVNIFYTDKNAFNEAAINAAFPDKAVPVIVYCGGLYCPLSAPAVEDLINWGYGEVYYYREGLPAWEKAGFPVE